MSLFTYEQYLLFFFLVFFISFFLYAKFIISIKIKNFHIKLQTYNVKNFKSYLNKAVKL